jgi:hypothetical protein
MGICIAGVAAIVDGVVLPHKVPSVDVIDEAIAVIINAVACRLACKDGRGNMRRSRRPFVMAL